MQDQGIKCKVISTRVGKGCATALKRAGARVIITKADPICALQALTEEIAVLTIDGVLCDEDIFVTATGGRDINVIVCNFGHFDYENDVQVLERVTLASRGSLLRLRLTDGSFLKPTLVSLFLRRDVSSH